MAKSTYTLQGGKGGDREKKGKPSRSFREAPFATGPKQHRSVRSLVLRTCPHRHSPPARLARAAGDPSLVDAGHGQPRSARATWLTDSSPQKFRKRDAGAGRPAAPSQTGRPRPKRERFYRPPPRAGIIGCLGLPDSCESASERSKSVPSIARGFP